MRGQRHADLPLVCARLPRLGALGLAQALALGLVRGGRGRQRDVGGLPALLVGMPAADPRLAGHAVLGQQLTEDARCLARLLGRARIGEELARIGRHDDPIAQPLARLVGHLVLAQLVAQPLEHALGVEVPLHPPVVAHDGTVRPGRM